MIYHNIKTSGGGNNTVETNRGKAGAANIAEQTKEGDEPLWPIGSFEDDDIEDDIKEGERERNRQKFVTYVSCDEWERGGARINNTREIIRTDDDDDDDYTFLVCVLQQTDL